jgi:sigma-70-like protein
VKANATGLPPSAAVTAPAPAEAVTALYQAHALGLIRLAVVMLGDRPAAEDAVQEAFCGLYRRWHHLSDPGKALSYVRSSVINSCRTMLRRRRRQAGLDPSAGDPPGESAEAWRWSARSTGRCWTQGQHVDPVVESVLWSDLSGRVLIGIISSAGRKWIGIISGNTFTPLNDRWPRTGYIFGAW